MIELVLLPKLLFQCSF